MKTKKKGKKSKKTANGDAEPAADVKSQGTDPDISAPINTAATTTSAEPAEAGEVQQRKMHASVEEADDE